MSFPRDLLTWTEHFAAVERRDKTFECRIVVRKDDCTFMVGDVLILREYDPNDPEGVGFTGRSLRQTITHVLRGGQFGIESGYVVLGIKD